MSFPSAQRNAVSFIPLNGDERRVTLLEEVHGSPHTSLLGRPEERKCDEDEEFHNKVNKRINDPAAPGSPGRGSSSHALSRDAAALSALSNLHPVEVNQGPPPCNQTLFPNTSTPPEASSEHLASAFWNWVNTGIADPGVTSPAAEQIEARLSSGSAASISDLTEQFGRMFGSQCARMNLAPMFGGDQDRSSAEIEQRGTKLASMCAMKGRTHADSRSTNLTDSDMSDFSSGSEVSGDLVPGLHVSRYFPARDSPLTASSLDPWTRQMRAACTSQVREAVESSKFDQGSCCRGGVNNPRERVWYPRQPSPPPPQPAEPSSIDNQAELHQAPTLMNESTWKWSGKLPRMIHTNPVFSTKVFLGGTQGSITEANLLGSFSAFGNVTVEWPRKNSKFRWGIPKGHVYLLFESEEGVRALLRACKRFDEDDHHALYLYMMSMVSHNHESSHVVEVIPWVVADSSIVLDSRECLDTGLNVFVGALHGLITAKGLADVLNDLFGGVVYVRIDIDKHRYPMGACTPELFDLYRAAVEIRMGAGSTPSG